MPASSPQPQVLVRPQFSCCQSERAQGWQSPMCPSPSQDQGRQCLKSSCTLASGNRTQKGLGPAALSELAARSQAFPADLTEHLEAAQKSPLPT